MIAKSFEKRELIRRELLAASEKLCSKSDRSELEIALRSYKPMLERALILEWVPDQAEDIYWVLIGLNEIVKIEVPRGASSEGEGASIKEMDMETYRRKSHSKEVREKLEIACEMMCR